MTAEPADIVERLLSVADLDTRSGEPLGKACREAAAEITRLRAALAEQKEACARVAETDDGLADGGNMDFGPNVAKRIAASIRAME